MTAKLYPIGTMYTFHGKLYIPVDHYSEDGIILINVIVSTFGQHATALRLGVIYTS